MSQMIDTLARRVADAAAGINWLHNAAQHVGDDRSARSILYTAEAAVYEGFTDAIREYRAHIEAAAFLARPEVRGPLEKLGEMEAVSGAE